jgi:hypothetical protein
MRKTAPFSVFAKPNLLDLAVQVEFQGRLLLRKASGGEGVESGEARVLIAINFAVAPTSRVLLSAACPSAVSEIALTAITARLGRLMTIGIASPDRFL